MIGSGLALGVFVLTVTLVIWQPRGLGTGRAALIGAALALALGVVRFADVPAVWSATWNATATLVGLIVISLLLDEAGFFRWGALHVGRWGRGSGLRLFVLLVVFAAGVSALFANDGAVLILTPLVLELAAALGFGRAATIAFSLAVGFVVDVTSLPLVVSNLVNIVVADAFGISFGRYASVMLPVNLAALLASLVVLLLVFRRVLPARYDLASLAEPHTALRSRGVFLTAWLLLPTLLLGYFFAEPLGVPLSAVTATGAAALWLVAGRSQNVSSRRVLRGAPWGVVVFSLGMYLVVYGLREGGYTILLADLLRRAAGEGVTVGVLVTGGVTALLSAAMNNLPAVLFTVLSVHEVGSAGGAAPLASREALAFAAVVGADVGPKLTPIGSLATLLWLHVLNGRGLNITWGEYFKVGVVLTLPVLLVALLTLAGRLLLWP